MDEIKIGSNKSFGIVFFIVFLLIAVYPLNKIWFKFGLLLGRIVSPLVMVIIFFLVVTPIGLLMRILNKDLLNLKFNKSKSYWIEKNEQKSKMKNQF